MFLLSPGTEFPPLEAIKSVDQPSNLLFGDVTACEADPKFGLHDKENVVLLALILLSCGLWLVEFQVPDERAANCPDRQEIGCSHPDCCIQDIFL